MSEVHALSSAASASPPASLSPGDTETFSEGLLPLLFACSSVPISAWLSWPAALLLAHFASLCPVRDH